MTLQSITAGAIKYLQNRFCEEARPGIPEFAETDQPPETSPVVGSVKEVGANKLAPLNFGVTKFKRTVTVTHF